MRLLGMIGFTSFVSSLTSGAATPPVHRPKEEKLPSEVCDFEDLPILTLATGDRFISSTGATQELCKTLRNPTINSSSKVRVVVKDTSEKRTLSQWCPVDVTTIDELAQYLPNQIGDIDTKQVLNLLTDVAQSSNPKFAYDVLLLLVPFFDDVRVLTNADWLPGKGNETLALVDKASQFCHEGGAFILKNIMSPYCIQNDTFREVAQSISIQKLNAILEDIDSGSDITNALISNSIYQVSGDLAGLLSAIPQVYPGFLDFNDPQEEYIGNAHFSDSKRQEMNRQLQGVFPYEEISEHELPKYENKIDILYDIFGDNYGFYKTFLDDLAIEMKTRYDQNNDDIWLNAIHQFSNMLKDYPELKDLTGNDLKDRIRELKLEYDQKLGNKNGGFLIWELAYLRKEVVSRILESFFDAVLFNKSLSNDSYKKAVKILYNFIEAIKERNPDFTFSGKYLTAILKTSADNKFTESGVFQPFILNKINSHINRLIKEYKALSDLQK